LQKADFILAQNALKSFIAGLRPDPLIAYSAPPDPLAAFDGLTSKRGEVKGGEKGEERGRVGRRREEMGGRCYATAHHRSAQVWPGLFAIFANVIADNDIDRPTFR